MQATISFQTALERLRTYELSLDTLDQLCAQLGFNHPTYFGDFDIGGLELQQIPKEIGALAEFLVRTAPRAKLRYLEVGVGSCGTLVFLHEVFKRNGLTLQLFGADNFLYQDAGVLQNQKARIDWARNNLGATFYIGSTASEGFSEFLRDKIFDIVFIDSEHSYEACIREFLLCQARLAPDGVMVFHDIASEQCPQIIAAYEKIKPYFGFTKEIIHSDKCGIGICRKLVRPLKIDDVVELYARKPPTKSPSPEIGMLHHALRKRNETHEILVRQLKTVQGEVRSIRGELDLAQAERDHLAVEVAEQRNQVDVLSARLKLAANHFNIVRPLRTTAKKFLWRTRFTRIPVNAIVSCVRGIPVTAPMQGESDRYFFLDRPAHRKLHFLTKTAQLAISGWAVDLKRHSPIKVRARLGKQVCNVVPKDRADVQRVFAREAAISTECGFESVTEVPFGIHRLVVEMESVSGNWQRIFDAFVLRLSSSPRRARTPSLSHWKKIVNSANAREASEIKDHIDVMPIKPTFSVVIDARRRGNADETIRSLQNQIYKNCDICILSRDETSSFQRGTLKVRKIDDAAEFQVSGDFVIFLKSGDKLDPFALYEFTSAINGKPDLDLIYADEELGRPADQSPQQFFKPDWSPDYLETFNYVGYPACFRADLAVRCFENWHYYDFVLRFTECTDSIHHIRKVLCTRSAGLNWASSVEESELDRMALLGRLKRTGRSGSVVVAASKNCGHYYSIELQLRRNPLVSIVIPTAGKIVDFDNRTIDLIVNCVSRIKRDSTYRNIEIVIIDNGDLGAERLANLEAHGCRFATYAETKINIAKKINLGASVAKGEFLLLLNDDIEIISENWIEHMLSHFEKRHVGVVGAKLLYVNHQIQHVGVVHNGGNADHVSRGRDRGDEGYFFSSVGARNFMAVTGACMMTPASVFWRVGGFSESFAVSYNDADYCLKVRSALGLSILCDAQTELIHLESQSRAAVLDMSEWNLYHSTWARDLVSDPFYNERHLSLAPPTFEPCFNRRPF